MKTFNNSWTGRNRKGEWWTNITGKWIMATSPYQIDLMKDIINLSKIKTLDVSEQINTTILSLKNIDEFEKEILQNNTISENLLKPNHLVRYLKDTNQKLTKLEIDTLECILSQGSFYEESWWKEDEEWDGSAFIGWYIDEKEVQGCRGALSSLKKKGIIDIGSDDVNGEQMPCYWTKHILDFVEDGYYHQLDIPKEFIK